MPIKLGIESDRLEQMDRLYRFNNTDDFVKNYLEWDDHRFLETFCPLHEPQRGAKSGAMLRRLRERHLLKQVFTAEIETFDARIRETVKALPKTEKDQVRTEIEQKVAEFLPRELGVKVDPDFVIVHAYDIKSATSGRRSFRRCGRRRLRRQLRRSARPGNR